MLLWQRWRHRYLSRTLVLSDPGFIFLNHIILEFKSWPRQWPCLRLIVNRLFRHLELLHDLVNDFFLLFSHLKAWEVGVRPVRISIAFFRCLHYNLCRIRLLAGKF
jgi:hypothetical protein